MGLFRVGNPMCYYCHVINDIRGGYMHPLGTLIHNWLILFFSHRSHSTFFAGVISSSLNINCSLVQGSVFAPVSYAVSTSKLKPKNDSNSMLKYADDAYLIVPD